MYKNKNSDYHIKKFRKCPFCNLECKRYIDKNKRNKGRQKTCGSKECIYKAQNNPEVVKKKVHHGSEHPLWIPDRSKVKFRPRYEMTKWQKDVFERDNYTCQVCGQYGGKLQAHHILGYNQFPLHRFDVNNGITLCILCHKKTDNYGSRGR